MRIFLCYRPDVTQQLTASRFRSHLAAACPGADIISHAGLVGTPGERASRIISIVAGSDALVLLISPGWLDCRGPSGRLLDDPLDAVKAALMVAMNRRIPLVPVLLDNAAMPQRHQLPQALYGLAQCAPVTVREGQFAADFGAVAARLAPGPVLVAVPSAAPLPPLWRRIGPDEWAAVAAIAGIAAAAIATWVLLRG